MYDKATTKITVIRTVHGPWRPIARDHTNSAAGCPECGGVRRLSLEDWIERARRKHGDRFDCSKFNYTTLTDEVVIICPVHGEYQQQAGAQLRGFGCSQCSGCRRGTTEEWIARARAVRGERYDYSKSVYVNSKTNLIIVCREHGEFAKQPQATAAIVELTGRSCSTAGAEACGTEQVGPDEVQAALGILEKMAGILRTRQCLVVSV